jgi:pyruvate dehydrogenase E1 component beta subunit
MKGPVPGPEDDEVIAVGKAEIKNEGTDVTVVAVSRMVHEAMKATEELKIEGISVEVIDLRSISPWDKELVYNSVGKTHRLIIAHEAVKHFGIGAEIAASVAEEILDELDGPILRVGSPDAPVPFALEEEYLPKAVDVKDVVIKSVKSLL